MARISACSDASIAAQRSGRCSSTLAPKLKCGPFGVEQHAAQPRAAAVRERTRACSAAIIAASTRLALGRARRRRNSAPSRSSQALAHSAAAIASARLALTRAAPGIRLSVNASSQPWPAGERLAQRDEVDFAVSFVPSLKARKPARASVIMLSASHAREFSLLRFHASSLGLRSSSIVLVVQSGKVSSSFAHSSSTFASSRDRSTLPRASSALPSFGASPVLKLAEHEAAEFVGDALRLDQRIGDELAVDLERRNDVGDDSPCSRPCAPRTARTARRRPSPARCRSSAAGSRWRRRSAPSRASGRPDRSARGPARPRNRRPCRSPGRRRCACR